jgi:PIN domain nuclease of toxin-antitoxin system
VIVLDAYALIAAARKEPAAADVERLLRAGGCAISAVNLAEVIDRLCRLDGATIEEVARFVEPLLGEHLAVRSATEETAWRAGAIRARFYSKQSPLSLGDSFLLASTEAGDELATADPVVAATAKELGLELAPLPDSGGRVPDA